MRNRFRGTATAAVVGLGILAGQGLAQQAPAAGDAYMGDWQGTLKAADATESPLVAQIICWGGGKYQANLLEALDQRLDPVAVLQGELAQGKLVFGEATVVDGETFTGTTTEERPGTFVLKKTRRQSVTLGAKPPAGAVVLLDGSSLNEWRSVSRKVPGVVDLRQEIGGDQRAAYLRNRIWSDAEQDVSLEIGSDDGVKVWLNGEVVHANNTPRPLKVGQDRVTAHLKREWNPILVKVTQGGGDWAACVRVGRTDGGPLPGLRSEVAPPPKPGQAQPGALGDSDGFVLAWEVSGPYTQEGKDGMSLFDVVFAPEKPEAEAATWKVVNPPAADPDQVRWALLPDGAMAVTPGGGSIVSRRTFRDHRLHLEFRTPFMPDARGQGRGNSGVYLQGRYEIQVLDSYGLEGLDNECGGIYKVAVPRVNMCAPPLQWQTYDITFLAPRFDDKGAKTADARVTVLHNGVLIHEDVHIPGPTGGGLDQNVAEPGGIYLQDHGNPVQFRNIWVVENL